MVPDRGIKQMHDQSSVRIGAPTQISESGLGTLLHGTGTRIPISVLSQNLTANSISKIVQANRPSQLPLLFSSPLLSRPPSTRVLYSQLPDVCKNDYYCITPNS